MVVRRGAKPPPKKKSFADAAVDAARAAVETVTVRESGKLPRRRVTFDGFDPLPGSSTDEHKTRRKTELASGVAAKRAAVGGIVEAKKWPREKGTEAAAGRGMKKSRMEKKEAGDDDGEAYSDDDDNREEEHTGSDSDDNLSSIAGDGDDDDTSDEGAWEENPFEKAKRDGTRLSYSVLRLRFLPAEFEEPQLFKFLSQFGANVLNCFCVRSRRTHQSKGIAYVQFDTESVLPTVVEECHGMALGGRAVQARCVTLHRSMPTKERVAERRRLAYEYKTRGAPLQRHDMRRKSPIAALIRHTRAEEVNNAHLKRLGIDYECHDFKEQLAKVPAALIVRKRRGKKRERSGSRSSKSSRMRWAERQGDGEAGKKVKGNGVRSTVVSSLPMASMNVAKDASVTPSAERLGKNKSNKRNKNDNAEKTTTSARNNNNNKGDDNTDTATSSTPAVVSHATKRKKGSAAGKPRVIAIGG